MALQDYLQALCALTGSSSSPVLLSFLGLVSTAQNDMHSPITPSSPTTPTARATKSFNSSLPSPVRTSARAQGGGMASALLRRHMKHATTRVRSATDNGMQPLPTGSAAADGGGGGVGPALAFAIAGAEGDSDRGEGSTAGSADGDELEAQCDERKDSGGLPLLGSPPPSPSQLSPQQQQQQQQQWQQQRRSGSLLFVPDSVAGAVCAQSGRRLVHLTKLAEYVRPGDLVLFRSYNTLSGLQRKVCGSEWDHIGIVVTRKRHSSIPMLLEATGEGVSSLPLIPRLRAYSRGFAERIAIRRLVAERSPDRLRALLKFANRVRGKPYSLTAGKLLGSSQSRGVLLPQTVSVNTGSVRMMCSASVAGSLSAHDVVRVEVTAASMAAVDGDSDSDGRGESEKEGSKGSAASSGDGDDGNGDGGNGGGDGGDVGEEVQDVEVVVSSVARVHSEVVYLMDAYTGASVEGARMFKCNENFFCSELAAAALKAMRLLPDDRSSSAYWPSSFSVGGSLDADLLEGATLEQPVVVNCQVLEVARAVAVPQPAASDTATDTDSGTDTANDTATTTASETSAAEPIGVVSGDSEAPATPITTAHAVGTPPNPADIIPEE